MWGRGPWIVTITYLGFIVIITDLVLLFMIWCSFLKAMSSWSWPSSWVENYAADTSQSTFSYQLKQSPKQNFSAWNDTFCVQKTLKVAKHLKHAAKANISPKQHNLCSASTYIQWHNRKQNAKPWFQNKQVQLRFCCVYTSPLGDDCVWKHLQFCVRHL